MSAHSRSASWRLPRRPCRRLPARPRRCESARPCRSPGPSRPSRSASRPAVRAFLQAWFNTIAFMKANKAKTVDITAKVLNLSPAVIDRAYDEEIGIFSDDGVFDPKAVAALKQSFIEM